MDQIRRSARPLLRLFLFAFVAVSIYAPASQAALISTKQVMNQQQTEEARSKVHELLERDSVKQQLSAMGVDSNEIQARVDNMTDREVAIMADRMDQLPAGKGILGTAVFIFLVLLITDILGYTNVFSFVKSHR